ncbi:MAG TPA: DUF3604 domain-containing protein [bacterium]|nr:DUF3604 domain-containing protein [bacterium]
MSLRINRRGFLHSAFCTAAFSSHVRQAAAKHKDPPAQNAYRVFFGDLHNHNDVGYAKGSLQRAFDIAHSHLDFFALTPHAQWHDMPLMEGDRHLKWVNGFKRTKTLWPDVQRITAEYNQPGRFVTFPGWEWHSSFYGDYCILFPDDRSEMKLLNDLTDLKKFAVACKALLIPHHPGYRQGHRGANLDFLDESVSPVLEIYSEHGNAEQPNAPFPYLRHSLGGCWSKNTLQHALACGKRIGVIASTDDHLGYPGAYGEGLAAVWAQDLSRESVLEAIRKRRTYGVSGDRIQLDFRLNNRYMGEAISFSQEREGSIRVKGWDALDRIEVLKNNQVIQRNFPCDRSVDARCWDQPVLLRIEFGWGPWAAMDLARICDWDFDIKISDGALLDVHPCFQSGPFSEEKRNRIKNKTAAGCSVQSYTSRREAFAENPTNAVVLCLSGNSETRISLTVHQPQPHAFEKSLAEFAQHNDILFTGPFPAESLRIQPLVFSAHYQTEFSFNDRADTDEVHWYYVRVLQKNGQLAWSSPVWVEKS